MIISLQVLGQVAFDFDLSIAQILIAIGTCAVLEVAIAFRGRHVLMWPASAMLTGNGVAFVLRVPGTEHGDWWSLHGWWIYAVTAAGGLLSKYVIRIGGGIRSTRPTSAWSCASSCSARHVQSRSTSGGGRCRRGWCSPSRSSSVAGSPSSGACTCS